GASAQELDVAHDLQAASVAAIVGPPLRVVEPAVDCDLAALAQERRARAGRAIEWGPADAHRVGGGPAPDRNAQIAALLAAATREHGILCQVADQVDAVHVTLLPPQILGV